ncbi:MAG TPA: hypothetical protein VMS30_09070 [Phycisphaerales bacterium]|nr:hypothetical protein [Phycisphaerales bacterium]
MRMSFAHVRLSVASILVAVMLLSFVRPAVAQEPGAGAPPAASSADNRDEAIIRLLETTVVDVAYDRIDFEKIIQELRDRHSLNIHISWTELEAAGVRRDQRIEMKLKSVTLSTLLDLLLREAAAGSKAADEVVYHVESGVIVIDLGQRRREERIMRMYPVSDLLESGYAIRRFANTPVLGMELTGREFVGGERPQQPDAGGFGGGGGGASPSIFGSSGEDPQRVTEMERVQQLIDLVTECVEPDSWDIAGGDIGSIRYANASLIIRQTLRNHQKLAAFLAMLRETRPQPLNADVAIVRLRADKAAELRQAAGERFPRLAPEALQALAMAGDAQGVLFRATTSGAAGQAMLLSALTQREAVTSAHAIVGDQSSAYEPQSTTSTAGLELILLPLVVPGSEAMTLDVQMALVPPAQVTPRAVRLGVGAADTTIDQVQRSMRTVSSQTSVALGDVIALTIPQEINSQAAAAEYEDWLLVRVRKAE